MAQLTDGYVVPFSFERKSIPDLFGTLTKGYPRFKKEINRAKEDRVQLIIIIEGNLSTIQKGSPYWRNKLAKLKKENAPIYKIESLEDKIIKQAGAVIKTLFTLWIRHGVSFVCCKDREDMTEYITSFFIAVGRERVRKGKTE